MFLIFRNIVNVFFVFLVSVNIHSVEISKIHLQPDFQVEVWDPLHRHHAIVKPAYNIWREKWLESYPDFITFLMEKRNLLEIVYPALYDPSYNMIWLDHKGRQDYKAVFTMNEDGSIAVHTLQHGDLSDGVWLYVVIDGDYYVGPEIKYQFHHTSLTAGESVEAAGTLHIRGNKLVLISLSSGHYRPSIIHGRQSVESLYAHGLDLSQLMISYTIIKGGVKKKERRPVPEFMSLDLPLFNEDSEDHANPYLIELKALQLHPGGKAELFINRDNEIFIGSNNLTTDHPFCRSLGEDIVNASVNISDGGFLRVVFNIDIAQKYAVDIIARFMHGMQNENVDLENTQFRVLDDHVKREISFSELMAIIEYY